MGTAAQRALVLRIIWFAITFSVVLYALVAYLVDQSRARPGAAPPPAVVPPSLATYAPFVALALAAGAMALAGLLVSLISSPGSMSASEAAAAGVPAPTPDWNATQRAVIVGAAIAELPAILGLVLYFLGLPFRPFLYFLVASLVAHGANFLRMQNLIAACESAAPADFTTV